MNFDEMAYPEIIYIDGQEHKASRDLVLTSLIQMNQM